MRGKMKILLICIVLICTVGNVYGYYSQECWESSAVSQLESLDIIRNADTHWNKTDYITRRDAFQIAFIVKEMRRDYYYNAKNVRGKFSEFHEMLNNSGIARAYNWSFEFSDIEEGSDDYYLMATLFTEGISGGRKKDGKLYAQLDEPITYNEAFATILRITFPVPGSEAMLLYKNPTETVYYDFAKEMKLFSSDSIYDQFYYEYAPKVSIGQLNEPVRAYEYLYYVYRALYIPTEPLGDYAPQPLSYRINDFKSMGGTKIMGSDITI